MNMVLGLLALFVVIIVIMGKWNLALLREVTAHEQKISDLETQIWIHQANEKGLKEEISLFLKEGDFSRVRGELDQEAAVVWTEVYDYNTSVVHERYSGPDAEERAGKHVAGERYETLTWNRLRPEEFLGKDRAILYRLLLKQ